MEITAGTSEAQTAFSARTAWARNLETPLRTFLRTETGSAAVLLAGVVAALVWANVDMTSYAHVWEKTTLSIHIGDTGLSHSLRYWVNSGLMTLFFFVTGLEARREFDLGELRERRRATLPLAAGVGGMVVPVAIFLALNAQRSSAHGWGTAMSTDTAFALGLLALLGSRLPFRLRAFVLTFSVADDVIALVVIATAYAAGVDVGALFEAVAIFALIFLAVRLRIDRGAVYAIIGVATWIALSKSGIDPIVVGLTMGLLTYAAPAARSDLERASDLFRLFREQPTPELARSAQAGAACVRLWDGLPSSAAARSRESGSPSRCSLRILPSAATSSPRRRRESSARCSALRSCRGRRFAPRRCCRGSDGSARCSARRSRSSISPSPWILNAITSAARWMHR